MNKEINHVAIIMDGNRRYAQKKGTEKIKGHEFGKETLLNALQWCVDEKIGELTVHALSIQNLENRSQEELDSLFNMLRKEFQQIEKNEHKINKLGLRVNFLGRLELLPEDVQIICKKIVERTKNNSNYKFNIGLGYGGREEIIDAVKKIVDEKIQSQKITEDLVSKYLYCNSEPDLVIRTSGEVRTSNFLIWQTIYSEWFFIDKTWPEFTKEDFISILKEFKEKRERRFGK